MAHISRAPLAIDAGQTGVRVRLPNGRSIDLAGVRTDSPLAPQIASAVDTVTHDLEIDGVPIVGGVSGLIDPQAEAESVSELLAHRAPGEIRLAHDSVTAYLGGLGSGPGVAVAAGTGVVALAVGQQAIRRIDGWGHLIGDAGSGFWIGRAALDAVMRAFDGRGPATLLTPRVHEAFSDLESMYVQIQGDPDRVAVIARYARIVDELSSEDAVCRGILESAGRELAATARAGIDAVGLGGERVDVCLLGAVSRSDVVVAAMSSALADRVPHATVRRAVSDALMGAAALADVEHTHPLYRSIGVA